MIYFASLVALLVLFIILGACTGAPLLMKNKAALGESEPKDDKPAGVPER